LENGNWSPIFFAKHRVNCLGQRLCIIMRYCQMWQQSVTGRNRADRKSELEIIKGHSPAKGRAAYDSGKGKRGYTMLIRRGEVDREALPQWKREALEAFEKKMIDKHQPFPCIPATQGFSLDHFRYGFAGNPKEKSSVKTLASLLEEFTKCSRQCGPYTSLIIFFETSSEEFRSWTVEQFEQLFWDMLDHLHKLDEAAWPPHIPLDPHNPLWEFCFRGEPYFMFCATPAHTKRNSRYFPQFMLAITPRWVLQHFHASPSSMKIQAEIRKRLDRYDLIPAHPHLNSYGNDDNYEWLQYFLRDDETSLAKCPFHAYLRDQP